MLTTLRVCSITHNPFLDSESRFTGLASCKWMLNPKTDCTLNIVTVIFLLRHLFNDDEEVYDPSSPNGCINCHRSCWKLRKMWDDADWGNPNKPDTIWHKLSRESQSRFGFWIIKWPIQNWIRFNPYKNPSNPGLKEDYLDCESGLRLSIKSMVIEQSRFRDPG